MRDIFLLAFAFALAILPLSSNFIAAHIFGSGGRNDSVLFLALVLLTFYSQAIFSRKIRLRKFIVQLSFALSFLFLWTSFTGVIGHVNLSPILHWLTVIWLIPCIDWLLRSYPRPLLMYMTLGILVWHAQWGIAQFVAQHDLGLSYLGESRLSADAVGVAKFSLGDNKLIRAYGPYSHSNSLAGSLVIGLVLLLFLPLFTKEGWPEGPEWSLVICTLVFTLMLGILVSFSRSAYISVVLLALLTGLRNGWIYFRKIIVIGVITVVVFAPLLYARFTDTRDQAISERASGLQWYIGVMRELPFWRGLGPGNYKTALCDYLDGNHLLFESWHVAPVHNAFLLFTAEWGIATTALLICLGIWLTTRTPTLTRSRLLFIVIPMLPLALTDHYLITQTAPLVWAMLSVTLTKGDD